MIWDVETLEQSGRRHNIVYDREHPVCVKSLHRLCRPLRIVVLVYKECVDGGWLVCCMNFMEKHGRDVEVSYKYLLGCAWFSRYYGHFCLSPALSEASLAYGKIE